MTKPLYACSVPDRSIPAFALAFVVAGIFAGCSEKPSTQTSGTATVTATKPAAKLLNVSYDPTREFYVEFNKNFAEYWKQKEGQDVAIEQSHGGSGKQSKSVIEGNEADVVTLALAVDIDAIAAKGLLDPDWQKQFDNNSSPYTSTIVLLVRKGNPKQIKDWDDLIKPGVGVVTAHPKTGGGARWNYLAAWGYALKNELGDVAKVKDADPAVLEVANAKAQEFVKQIFGNVVSLEKGARDATNAFAKNGIGDVLITWENEAFLVTNGKAKDEFEVVVPSISILAEPPVAVVNKNADKKGTTEVAKAYLQHLYSPAGQQLAAKHFYRPAVEGSVAQDDLKHFAKLELFKIDDVFGGWKKAQKEHFDAKGTFDQIYQVK